MNQVPAGIHWLTAHHPTPGRMNDPQTGGRGSSRLGVLAAFVYIPLRFH
jgi:hypothetical protein